MGWCKRRRFMGEGFGAARKSGSCLFIMANALLDSLVSGFLVVSAVQLRQLFDFDNDCAERIGGGPQRICSCKEDSNEGATEDVHIESLKKTICQMWTKAMTFAEIFIDHQHEELGYRLRVKQGQCIPVNFPSSTRFYFGWCCEIPKDVACPHIYNRSPIEPNGYMGGPASFLNWSSKKFATAKIQRPIASSVRQFLVRLECSNLGGGVELTWDYGHPSSMLESSPWFLPECCSIIEAVVERQQKKRKLDKMWTSHEQCVLCGEAFPDNNKEKRIQRKQHFINLHADYLGSDWDGISGQPYRGEVVSKRKVLIEADRLNSLLNTLTKTLKWNVIPACTVMKETDFMQYATDDKSLIEEFMKRCKLLRDNRSLVLRGMAAVSGNAQNLTVNHLKPIDTTRWSNIKWDFSGQPVRGLYGLPIDVNQSDHAKSTEELIHDFCKEALNG